MKKQVFIISGPTCSGESSVTREIIKKYQIFHRMVTASSRKPRLKERDKIDYYFFSKEKFEEEIKNGNILEYTYIENRGEYYGAYLPELEEKLKSGKIIVNVDHIGLKFYKEKYNASSVFVKTESLEIIKSRLIRRNPKITDEYLAKRLKNAQDEIENEERFYDYVVINKEGKLAEAVLEVEKILKREGYIDN